MSAKRYDVAVLDWTKAQATAAQVRVGTYFVFSETAPAPSGGRLARLLVKPAKGRAVLPLMGKPLELPGIRITPHDRTIDPLATLCADRDLYRTEQDTVNLFCAVPAAAGAFGKSGLSIALDTNGTVLTERAVDLGKEGVGIESFSALLAGRYTARLKRNGRAIGPEASFTVAEYTLAPLSGRLASFRLDRAANALHVELAVESYQVPFDRDLNVALVESGREVSRVVMKARAPGLYSGSLAVAGGDGPLRLRLSSVEDAGRIAEVAIPGSKKRERETTLVSELGREMLLSLMPEADALPMRGAFLTEGDFLSTPVTVEKLDAAQGVIRAQADIEALTLVVLDVATGTYSFVEKGNVSAGSEITVVPSPVATVFVGGYVEGEPFEGFTTFFRPNRMQLGLEAPVTVKPREEIAIRLSCTNGPEAVPVLLCVRDQRLTSVETPESGLASSVKTSIDAATDGMKDAAFTTLERFLEAPRPSMAGGRVFDRNSMVPMAPSSAPARDGEAIGALLHEVVEGFGGDGALEDDGVEISLDAAFDAEEPTGSVAMPAAARSALSKGEAPGERLKRADEMSAGNMTGRKTPAPVAPPPRADFPEVLFYGLVPVRGTETVRIPAGDSLGTFTVEAFVLAEGDWVQATAAFAVDRPVRADLDVPPAVHESDRVIGTLRVATASGRARVSLTRDGQAVALRGIGTEIATPAELQFEVRPGVHLATVEDLASGETDRMEVIVATPGKFRSLVREVGLLQAGDAITLDSAQALSIRILPGVEKPFEKLVDATADYGHACCEQTAAKILSACVMYLTAHGPARQKKAEGVILAGIARERRMWKKGKGFSMYPENGDVNTYYSPLVVRHLWALAAIGDVPGISAALKGAVKEGLAMADDVARPFAVERIPSKIKSVEDAYAVAIGPEKRRPQAKDWIATAVDLKAKEPVPRSPRDRVTDRAMLSYAAAALLASGEMADGVRVANVVTRQLDENGRLYSTVDSVAAIALFTQLARAGVLGGVGRVKVNGKEMSSSDAVKLTDQIETVEIVSGVVPVEVTRIHEEDWSRFKADLPMRVGFRDGDGKKVTKFRMGDRVDIQVELPKGYHAGDLVHVALPASLSWIEGGGKVKRFTKDFEGKSEVSVPLVVTGAIEGKQQFAVCVRNMFEEERAASPGLLSIG